MLLQHNFYSIMGLVETYCSGTTRQHTYWTYDVNSHIHQASYGYWNWGNSNQRDPQLEFTVFVWRLRGNFHANNILKRFNCKKNACLKVSKSLIQIFWIRTDFLTKIDSLLRLVLKTEVKPHLSNVVQSILRSEELIFCFSQVPSKAMLMVGVIVHAVNIISIRPQTYIFQLL